MKHALLAAAWRAWAVPALGALVLVAAVFPQTCRALQPGDPQVKELVQKAVAFLSQAEVNDKNEKPLVGLALLKAEAGADHPRVLEAVEAIRNNDYKTVNCMYSLGISLIFLVTLDHHAHRAEVDRLLGRMLEIQKSHGGWGYLSNATGDTSMTQYGMLALWECEVRGIPTPTTAWDGVTLWLMRTQDPSGGFGYQAKDPGVLNALVAQTEVRNSLSAAGTGSLYIAWDHLKFDPPPKQQIRDPNEPESLRRIETEEQRAAARPQTTVNRDDIKASLARGDGWTAKNYTISPSRYTHYYLYAFERYQSFKEMSEGRLGQQSPWYDEGVAYLRSTQAGDGSWRSECGLVPDTCFAILFLVRSSMKSIAEHKPEALGDGLLIGGRELPKNLDELVNRQGKLEEKPLAGPAEQLLAILEDPENADFLKAVESFSAKALEADDATLSRQAARMRKLVAEGTPNARAAALLGLSRTRDLDQVPLLIYALNDPHWEVALVAHEALKFISRKFSGFGFDEPTEKDRKDMIKKWKEWYLTIRPGTDFED